MRYWRFKYNKYQVAKGDYWQNYIGEVDKWEDVSMIKYLWKKINGYKVRVTNFYVINSKL